MSDGIAYMNKNGTEVVTCGNCGKQKPVGVELPIDPSIKWCFGSCSPLAKASEDLAANGTPLVANIRTFDTGATRDTDEGKFDYEGFISPLVLECYAEYMHDNREQSDGNKRDSDNWQRGIPRQAYMKSGWRHFFDWWKLHRGYNARETIKVALCGLLFNVMGYLHTLLAEENKP